MAVDLAVLDDSVRDMGQQGVCLCVLCACLVCACVSVCVCVRGNYCNRSAGDAGEAGRLLINERSRWPWVGGSWEHAGGRQRQTELNVCVCVVFFVCVYVMCVCV